MAEFIRAESKQVRLTDPSVFLEEPFGFTEEELAEVWAEMAENDDYRDIRHAKDERTDEGFVHSDAFLTAQYARMMLRSPCERPGLLDRLDGARLSRGSTRVHRRGLL